jgi:2-oxoglutarate ferredoxin oxidoreductase subunit alpha
MEAIDILEGQGIYLDVMQVRAFPFDETVLKFFEAHQEVFIVEQNRDAQFRSLLINELNLPPQFLLSVLHYDGMPVPADTIVIQVRDHLSRVGIPDTLSQKLSVG